MQQNEIALDAKGWVLQRAGLAVGDGKDRPVVDAARVRDRELPLRRFGQLARRVRREITRLQLGGVAPEQLGGGAFHGGLGRRGAGGGGTVGLSDTPRPP